MSTRRIIFIVIAALLVVLIGYVAVMMLSPRTSPPAQVVYSDNGLEITIHYSRPFKKDRLIFGPESEGALQPYGSYWRLGANEATTFEVNRDILFGGEKLSAGKYALYAIPGPEAWTIGVNSEYDRWGFFEPDYDKDVLKITVPVTELPTVVEQLTLSIDEGNEAERYLVCRWDQTAVRIPITLPE